ncbi:hypothetical protein RCL1_000656 [Eukaryota sp. TZLM3-RCL]
MSVTVDSERFSAYISAKSVREAYGLETTTHEGDNGEFVLIEKDFATVPAVVLIEVALRKFFTVYVDKREEDGRFTLLRKFDSNG